MAIEKTAAFELDPTAGELNSPIRNQNGEQHRIKITEREHGSCVVTGSLKHAHYGTYGHQPAALIVFAFNFHFTRRPLFRYKSAEIKVTFAGIRNSGKGPQDEPQLVNCFPTTVYGKISPEPTAFRNEVDVSIGTNQLLPVDARVHINRVKEKSIIRSECMEIHGMASSPVARWTLHEDSVQKKGISKLFYCAAIVQLPSISTEFQAKIEVKVQTGVAILTDPRSWGLRVNLWGGDDPILFSAQCPHALPPLSKLVGIDLKDLDQETKREICPLALEYEV